MKKLKRHLLTSGTIFLLFFAFHTSAHAAYQYYRSITVTSTASVASGTQTNFPMLVNTTANWLKTTSTDAVNGRIQNANGYDLIFATSTACAGSLNFETELYVSSTGQLVDWVNVPTLATGTTIYSVLREYCHFYRPIPSLKRLGRELQGRVALAGWNNPIGA